MESIAVLTGTPVDARMGVECLASAGLSGLAYPLSDDPRRQTAFQISSQTEKNAVVRGVLENARARGCRSAFVYCNSLSSAVDFPPLAAETEMHIVTPLDVYRKLAPQYRRLGILAANAQGLSGIERTLFVANPALEMLGACALPVVLSIEAGEEPSSLVLRHQLPQLAEWFRLCGMEALILGCTHFPYLKAALAQRTSLPLIDPAEEMIRLLLNA
ncbi:aspartate/glutamate racemase family protein [Oscillibacter sp.]|uniref:aspartate/glutamate racemase family protein n=1 Tax=Oscillibacter sp. TaxID=1945593 RepID=UPI002625C7D2|nr:aspartate/glutamate racemase family protein [Oscillibacter sp.]MDD3346398.1 aspartate/glutamate racemase family protein [Oscillibacter sp.]